MNPQIKRGLRIVVLALVIAFVTIFTTTSLRMRALSADADDIRRYDTVDATEVSDALKSNDLTENTFNNLATSDSAESITAYNESTSSDSAGYDTADNESVTSESSKYITANTGRAAVPVPEDIADQIVEPRTDESAMTTDSATAADSATGADSTTGAKRSLMVAAPLSLSAQEDPLAIQGNLTVDGEEPGSDNIFTFELVSGSGGQSVLTTQNDEYGNIEFDAGNLENGSYIVRQAATQSEIADHPYMEFDESENEVTISGDYATAGSGWITNGGLYMAYGGGSGGPIYVKDESSGESVYAYCLYNSKIEPDNFWNNKAQFKAVVPATSLSGYTEISGVNIEDVRKVIYHFTVNYPQSTTQWDDVEAIIAYLTAGKTMNSYRHNLLNTCLKETVPDNFTLVLLYPYGNNSSGYSKTSAGSYDGRLQPLITGFLKDNRKATYNGILFENTNNVPPAGPVQVTIKGNKYLNGKVPGEDYTFNFELYDEEDTLLQTAESDAEGNIEFEPIEYDTPGTYTYTVKEVNDKVEGITYDTTEYEVTVKVTEEDFYNLSGNKFYSVRGKDLVYYMSTEPDSTDFPVYCIDFPAVAPGDVTSQSVVYTKLVNPDSATLEDYVTVNHYGDKLSENLRKLFYYLELHSDEYSVYQKKNIVWAATSNDFPGYEEILETAYAMDIPDDYDLVLFIPNGYDKEDPNRKQTLMGAVGAVMSADADSITFNNKKSTGYVLPATGGSGTVPFIIMGCSLATGSLMLLILRIYKKKKS